MWLKNSKGVEALDALIILVALVLTVAVASIVLITTTNTIQQKTLAQGAESRKNVAAGVEVVSVIGSDASPTDPEGTPHQLDYLHMMVRAYPGTSVPFNSTFILIEHGGVEQVVSYNATCQQDCNGISTTKYMAYYRVGPAYRQDYLNVGDSAKLAIKLFDPIEQGQQVRITIVPNYGPRTSITFEAPQVMLKSMQSLYPTA
jgi:archaellin